MANLRIVKIPLLERVVLEELASRWQVTTDEALTRLIRQAAQEEVTSQQGAGQCVQIQAEPEVANGG